ncbi:CHAT domain-containing tetratricopeptide repeat protein [Nostoc sp. MS1]|uniref:CHAT domain-containing tetratricopeptide repeat protein n=1 Tax=Nostoc sp. MS1 TaxID=2764711 RepID=UPI001CC60610|nr:CHAT domain-containing tetratricopeptide repeat protein [Nostoc sp. MS1]BCL35692.1 tetratricopeptide repeat domain protein [Nostoc sp. MS1]
MRQMANLRQWLFLPLVASIVLFSESSVVRAEQYTQYTGQATVANPTQAKADQIYQQAKELYEEGTAASQQQALIKFEQALSLYRNLGDRSSQSLTLGHIGKIYSDLGELQKSLSYLNQTLNLRRQLGDKTGETITLSNIGAVYSDLGELQKALDFFHQALSLNRQMGDKTREARSLNNIGSVYIDLEESQKALDYFHQSLLLRRQVGDKVGEARTLNNIGKIYLDLGAQQKALDYFNQSLPLYQQKGDKAGEAVTLNNIASVYLYGREQQKALNYYQKSLSLRKQIGDKLGEANSLNNIGAVYLDLAEKQKALDYFNQSLPLFEAVGNKLGLAATLNNIGRIYISLGEQPKALNNFQKSLPLYQQVGNRGGEALTLYHIATVHANQGNLDAALTQMKTVISIVEKLRTKVDSQELRTAYFATVQDYYQFYIDLLMQLHKQKPSQGYDALALETSERARARSLLDLLTEAKADIRQGVEPKLLTQEQELRQKLDATEQRRIKLLASKYDETQLQALDKEIAELLEQYNQLQTKIRTTSPRYAALTQPQPLSLAQIQQQVLDDNTLLLEYSLGEKRSYLWAVTNKSIISYELPKRAEIAAVVQKLRRDITTPYLTESPAIATLSQIILAPVAQQLGNKRLVFVSDGALQYVPFAALNTPGSSNYQPLLTNHEIIHLPSASTIALLRQDNKQRQPASQVLAVFADPVFSRDDERLQGKIKPSNLPATDTIALTRAATNSDINFERLLFTRTEAAQILSLVPANKGKQAFDFNASRTTATSKELSQYQIIHFATHGILNSQNPELSGVVLSLFDNQGTPQNGFLRLHDIFNLNLQAELVVLSACQTGLGEEIRGEGVIGLTRGFMYAGSPRVVVSLWSVDDQATSELMAGFYKKMLKEGLKPAAALRAAQLEIWRNQKYAAPYYWAAFTMQGEWR